MSGYATIGGDQPAVFGGDATKTTTTSIGMTVAQNTIKSYYPKIRLIVWGFITLFYLISLGTAQMELSVVKVSVKAVSTYYLFRYDICLQDQCTGWSIPGSAENSPDITGGCTSVKNNVRGAQAFAIIALLILFGIIVLLIMDMLGTLPQPNGPKIQIALMFVFLFCHMIYWAAEASLMNHAWCGAQQSLSDGSYGYKAGFGLSVSSWVFALLITGYDTYVIFTR